MMNYLTKYAQSDQHKSDVYGNNNSTIEPAALHCPILTKLCSLRPCSASNPFGMEICHYNSRMLQRLSYPLPKEDGVIDSPFLGKKTGWGYDAEAHSAARSPVIPLPHFPACHRRIFIHITMIKLTNSYRSV